MIGISEFFKRIKGAHMREVIIRTAVKGSLKTIAGLDIELEAISFSGDSLILKSLSSAARSAIFIKKTVILEDINRNQTLRKISDIR